MKWNLTENEKSTAIQRVKDAIEWNRQTDGKNIVAVLDRIREQRQYMAECPATQKQIDDISGAELVMAELGVFDVSA